MKKFINEDWLPLIEEVSKIESLPKILEKLKQLKLTQVIVPKAEQLFNCFNQCPLNKLKVIFVAKNPYYGLYNSGSAGVTPIANGLCYSTDSDYIPDSMRALLAEITLYNEDLFDFQSLETPDRDRWNVNIAQQGCLMLNRYLTTAVGSPLAHQHLWEMFTFHLLETLMFHKRPYVWVLFGQTNQALETSILEANPNHKVILSALPDIEYSFLGKHLFAKINRNLREIGHSDLSII